MSNVVEIGEHQKIWKLHNDIKNCIRENGVGIPKITIIGILQMNMQVLVADMLVLPEEKDDE